MQPVLRQPNNPDRRWPPYPKEESVRQRRKNNYNQRQNPTENMDALGSQHLFTVRCGPIPPRLVAKMQSHTPTATKQQSNKQNIHKPHLAKNKCTVDKKESSFPARIKLAAPSACSLHRVGRIHLRGGAAAGLGPNRLQRRHPAGASFQPAATRREPSVAAAVAANEKGGGRNQVCGKVQRLTNEPEDRQRKGTRRRRCYQNPSN